MCAIVVSAHYRSLLPHFAGSCHARCVWNERHATLQVIESGNHRHRIDKYLIIKLYLTCQSNISEGEVTDHCQEVHRKMADCPSCAHQTIRLFSSGHLAVIRIAVHDFRFHCRQAYCPCDRNRNVLGQPKSPPTGPTYFGYRLRCSGRIETNGPITWPVYPPKWDPVPWPFQPRRPIVSHLTSPGRRTTYKCSCTTVRWSLVADHLCYVNC